MTSQMFGTMTCMHIMHLYEQDTLICEYLVSHSDTRQCIGLGRNQRQHEDNKLFICILYAVLYTVLLYYCIETAG